VKHEQEADSGACTPILKAAPGSSLLTPHRAHQGGEANTGNRWQLQQLGCSKLLQGWERQGAVVPRGIAAAAAAAAAAA